MQKTGPVSARIQLDDGTVIRRHQDHVCVRESEAAAASITSEMPEAAPVAISEPDPTFEPDASSANTNSRDSPKSPVAPPRESPMNFCPKQSCPVQRRVRPAYLDDYQY